MKTIPDPVSVGPAPSYEVAQLRARLAEAEETLRAIRHGEVDAIVGGGQQGSQVFTLEGAEHPYRLLIQSMNEGALTLTADKTILYANQCFARMVNCPLEQVTGSSLRRFLSAADQATLRRHIKEGGHSGSKLHLSLQGADGSQLPVQLSIRELAKDSFNQVTIGMVVTDLTESRRTEELLRALTHRVVQVQEDERGRVALELHDHITQLLCAILVRTQALANILPPREGSAHQEAVQLREMLGQAAAEVERIARHLRSSVLHHLGLAAILRETTAEFTQRTGVSVRLENLKLPGRLAPDTELALYRILQEALHNVEKHARATHVTIHLFKLGGFVQLTVQDNGIGFDPEQLPAQRNGKSGLGLLSIRERATAVGGSLQIKSVRHSGTEIEVRIPLALRTEPLTK